MENCRICGGLFPDLRTLKIDYFYQMNEVSPKFELEKKNDPVGALYTIPDTCKECRGDLLDFIARWASGDVARERLQLEAVETGDGRNIPVRVNGRVIIMTAAEYASHQRLEN